MKFAGSRVFGRRVMRGGRSRRRAGRLRAGALRVESLEPRHLLASDVIAGGLLFRGDFTGAGGNIVTDGTVQVGYAPTTGEAFRSLVTLTGDITVDASTATLGFKGTASVIQGDGSLPLWSTATVASYSIADLLGGGTAISGMLFTVDGLSFTASSLRFENPDGGSTSDARLATQGRLSAAAIGSFAVDVGFENAVRIDPQGISLTGVSGTVASDFQLGGATIASAGLAVAYDTVGRTLAVSGASTIAFAGRTASLSLGTAATPGLVLSTGVLDRFEPRLSGSFAIAGGTMRLDDLSVLYSPATDTIAMVGTAAVSFSVLDVVAGQSTITLFDRGLVVQSGQVDSMQASFTGFLKIAGASVSASGLEVQYAAATDRLQFVGAAAIAVGNSAARLDLRKDPAAPERSGLVIEHGRISALSAQIDGRLKMAGVDAVLESLTVAYATGDGSSLESLRVAGGIRLDADFGGAGRITAAGTLAGDGLVIADGRVRSLSATADGTVEVAGASLALSRVAVAFVGATASSPERLAVQGTGTLSFGRNAATFKLGGDGLVISAGSVESLDAAFLAGIDLGNPLITAPNLFEVAGANVLATGLFARYARTSGSIQVGGEAQLRVGSSDITLALGTLGVPSATGLFIKNGRLESLAAGVAGTITIGEARLDVAGMTVAYAAASETLTLRGAAALTIGGNDPLQLSLGSDGLSIVAGEVRLGGSGAKIDAGKVAAAGGTLTVSGVDIAYDSTARLIRLVGQATYAMEGGTQVTLALPREKGGLGIDTRGRIASLDATLDGTLRVAGVTVTVATSASYVEDGFELSGTATLDVAGKGSASLVMPATPAERAGLRIAGGRVSTLSGKVSGAMTLDGLTVASEAIVFRYDATASTSRIAVAGTGTMTVGGTSVSLALGEVAVDGSITKPGVSLLNGDIDMVDIALTSDFNLGGVRMRSDAAGLAHQPDRTFTDNAGIQRTQPAWSVYGSVSMAAPFEAAIGLGSQANPALVIYEGGFVLRDFRVAVTDARLGWLGLSGLVLESKQTDSNTVTIVPRAEAARLPDGLEVGVDFTYDSGTLKSVALRYDSLTARETPDGATGYELVDGPRLQIPGTSLFLAGLEATLENLDSPANIVIKGHFSADVGERFTKEYANGAVVRYGTAAHVYGTLVGDRTGLRIGGTARIGADVPRAVSTPGTFAQRHDSWWSESGQTVPGTGGLVSEATKASADVILDWANGHYYGSFSGQIRIDLVDGRIGSLDARFGGVANFATADGRFALAGEASGFITYLGDFSGSIAVLIDPRALSPQAGGDDARVAFQTDSFGFPLAIGKNLKDGRVILNGDTAAKVIRDAQSAVAEGTASSAAPRAAEKMLEATLDVAALVRESAGNAQAKSLTLNIPFLTVDDLQYQTVVGGETLSLGRLDPKLVSVLGTNGSLASQSIGLPQGLQDALRAEWMTRGWEHFESSGLGTSPATVNLSEPDAFGLRRGSVTFRIFPFATRPTDFTADGSLTDQGRATFAANASRTFGDLGLGTPLVVRPLVRFNTPAVFDAGQEQKLVDRLFTVGQRRVLRSDEIVLTERVPTAFAVFVSSPEIDAALLEVARTLPDRSAEPTLGGSLPYSPGVLDLRKAQLIDRVAQRYRIAGDAEIDRIAKGAREGINGYDTTGDRYERNPDADLLRILDRFATLQQISDYLLPKAVSRFSSTPFAFVDVKPWTTPSIAPKLATTFDFAPPQVAFLDGTGGRANTLVATTVDAVTNRSSLWLEISPALHSSPTATLSLQFVEEAEVTANRWLVQRDAGGINGRWWLVEENRFLPGEVAARAVSTTQGGFLNGARRFEPGTEVLYLETIGNASPVVRRGVVTARYSDSEVSISSETADPASYDEQLSRYPVSHVKELWIRKAVVDLVDAPTGVERQVFTASLVPDHSGTTSANGGIYEVPKMQLGERVTFGRIPRLAGDAIDARLVRFPTSPALVGESAAATQHASGIPATDATRTWQWQIAGLSAGVNVPITAINGQAVSRSSQGIPLRELGAGDSALEFTFDWQETRLSPGAKYAYAVIDDGVNAPVYTNLVRYVPTPDLSGRVTGTVWTGPLQPSFTVVDRRQDGLTGRITLQNESAESVSGWKVAFDAPYRLVPLVDGRILAGGVITSIDVRPDGYRYVIEDQGVNREIPAGGSVSFDFEATFNGAAPAALKPARFATAVGLMPGSFTERRNPPPIPEVASPLAGLRVFIDASGNGRWDAGETFTFTGSTGDYAFHGLGSGRTYRVVVDLPKASPYRAANWSPTDPVAPSLTVVKTADLQTADFSLALARSVVYGRVFIDANGNGRFDAGERPNQNAVVTITAVDGRSLSMKVGGDGSYQFDLPSGFVPADRPTVGTAPTSDAGGTSTRVDDRGAAWDPPDPNTPPSAFAYDIPTGSTLVLDLDESPGLLGRIADFALSMVLGDYNAIVVKKSAFEFFIDEFQIFAGGVPGVSGLSTASGRLLVGGKQSLTFKVDATTGLLYDDVRIKDFGLSLGGNLDLGFGSMEVDGLDVRYVAADPVLDAPSEFRLAGRTTLDVAGVRVGIELRNQGLVIRDGRVASVDAALFGSFDIAGQRIDVGTLAANYDASTQQLILTGSSKLLAIGLDSRTLVRVGTTSKGSATVTGLESTAGLAVGMTVGGPGIPAGTTIASLGADERSVVLTVAADFGTEGMKLAFASPGSGGTSISLDNVRLVMAAGKVASLSATLAGTLSLDASTRIALDSLSFSYATPRAASGAAIAIAGATSLTLAANTATPIPALAITVDLRFGQDESWLRGVVQRASFDVGSYRIAFTGVRVEWMKADGSLRLAGAASLGTAAAATKGLSAAADVDLRWQAGRFDSFTTALSGQVNAGRATVEFTGIQAGYTASTDTLVLAGGAGLRLPAAANQAGSAGETNKTTKVFGATASIAVVAGSLTSLTGKIDTASLVIGGGALDLRSVLFAFSRQPDRITFSGSAALTVAGASLAVSLPAPGIVWQDGAFRSFACIASGSIPLQTQRLADDTTQTTSEIAGALSAFYDAQTSRLVLSGQATARFGTTLVTLAIPAAPGLVIVDGRLQSFALAADAAIGFGGESFTDVNRNGLWDRAETFTDANGNGNYDIGETFVDTNGNRLWDPAEPFVDANGNAQFDGGFQMSLSGGSVAYTAATGSEPGSLALAGKVRIDFDGAKSGSNAVEIDVAAPGIQIVDGQIETFSAALVAGFTLEHVTFAPTFGTRVGIRYERQAAALSLFGGVNLQVDANTFALTFGTSLTDPGIRLERGLVTYASASITTGLRIGDLEIAVKETGFTYDASASAWAIYGSASLTNVFSVGIDLGTRASPGLYVRDNDWEIRNGTFRAAGFDLGAIRLDEVTIGLQKTAGSWKVSGAAGLTLPMGIGAAGAFELVNGAVTSISVGAFSDTGIPIPSTPLFVTSIEGSIRNLDNLAAVSVTGRIGLMAGQSVTLVGKSARAAQFFGSFTLDASSLRLQADAYLGAINTGTTTKQVWTGLIGEGTAVILVDWSRNIYYGDISAKFLGGTFLATGRMGFSEADGLLMRGTARMRIPDTFPIIGGEEITGAGFQFQHKAGFETYVMGWGQLLGGARGLKYDAVNGTFSGIGTKDLEAINTGPVLRSAAFAEPFSVMSAAEGFMPSAEESTSEPLAAMAFAAAPLAATGGPSSIDAPALPGRPGTPGRIDTGRQTTRLTGQVNDPAVTAVHVSLFYSLDKAGEMEFAMPLAGTLSPATGIEVPVNADGSWSVDIDWDASSLPSGDLWIYGQVDDDGVWVPVYGASAGPFRVVRDIEGRITEPSGEVREGVAVMRGRAGVPVFADLDGDGIWDAGVEPRAISDDRGFWFLDVPGSDVLGGGSDVTIIHALPDYVSPVPSTSARQVVTLAEAGARFDLQVAFTRPVIGGSVLVNSGGKSDTLFDRLPQPVSGLAVVATAPDGRVYRVSTDNFGRYEIPVPTAGSYSVAVDFAGATFLGHPVRAARGEATVRRVTVPGAGRALADRFRVDAVGVVRDLDPEKTASLPSLVRLANDGFVSMIEFDGSLRGRSIELDPPELPAPTSYYLYDDQADRWELVVPPADEVALAGPSAFVIRDDLRILGGDLGITLRPRAGSPLSTADLREAFRAFHVVPSVAFEIQGLRLEGFVSEGPDGAAGRGGAIFNEGRTTVRDMSFVGNTARSSQTLAESGRGGAIHSGSGAELTLAGRLAFQGNSAGEGPALWTEGTLRFGAELPETNGASRRTKLLDIDIADEAGRAVPVAFTIRGSDAYRFVVANNALWLRPGTRLDAEGRSRFTGRVTVNSPAIEGPGPRAGSFRLDVIDVNEAPLAVRLSRRVIPENAPLGTVVGQFSSVDRDRGELFTYSLVAGRGSRDNTSFEIRGGQLVASESFNFEMRRSYSIRVRSTDRGGQFVERNFVIEVLDLPERRVAVGLALPPAFSAVAGVRTPFVFAEGPLSDANPSATRRIVVTLRVSRGELFGVNTAGITIGGTAQSRTFTGTVAALNRYFTDQRALITYRAPRTGGTMATLTAVADTPQGPRSRPASATIGIAPRGDALFQWIGRQEPLR